MQTSAEPILSRSQRVAKFFALKRNLAILLIAILVIGAGEELWMRFIPKYLQALGASVFIIGLYDAIRTLLGAIYAYPGGVVVDRWGFRRTFIVFNLVSILGYSLVLLVPHWGSVIAGMFLFLSWTCFSLPATLSLVGATLSANRYSMGIGVQSVIRRLPLMISPIFGGILIDRFGIISGVRLGLLISIVFSGTTILVQSLLRDDVRAKVLPTERWGLWRSLLELNAPVRRLLLSDILVRFCERIPYAWVVIFAMNYIGISAKEFGVLTLLEVLSASLCIIPMSHFADKSQREPFVLVTFVMFTIFPIILLLSRNLPMLMIAFVVRGLKEFGDTARKGLIVAQVNPERRGQIVGAYYLVRDLIVSVAAILGAYLWNLGPGLNFVTAAGFGAAGTIFYFRSVRQMRAAAAPIVLYSRRPR